MNLARALGALTALALIAIVFAVVALATALRLADADVVVNAHAVLAPAARRIAAAYDGQIATLRSDLSIPLSKAVLDRYARRVVVATIGDNEGVDGGLALRDVGIVGDGPQPVAGRRERAAIVGLAATVTRARQPQTASVALSNGDIVAIDAVALTNGAGIAWARERISASALRGRSATLPLIIGAAGSSLLLVGFAALIVWMIRRDARTVVTAIAELEADPTAQPTLPHGDFGRIGNAVADMAHRRARAEAEAQRNERLAAIGRLAANTAHEIRNPLNALRLQVEVLHRRVGPAVDDSSAKMRHEIERLDAVVGGMLDVRSDDAERRAPIDLCDVVRRAVDVVEIDATERRRVVVVGCDTAETVVDGDLGRLVQLVINLLTNALDAAPPNTIVDVRVTRGPAIRIIDRGPGIAARDLPQLFEPFFTTKANGTGLGLAIAHEIARNHEARIDVQSEPGETAFTIDFGAMHRG